ncbi:hypothetical protein Lepto7376_3130 [[Leptolyngbya] sp. PCC 7376]|uniref:hypothetical protein n=1 Tax=[Leptolyngbya] sp. PCC 7376 TaxID=111781 RepID=UPI00029F3329|nr:hypothetical protein [[Leptolyngbya] sp. PCC 7376]AFY39367.1 hypothetical protein Lepto7376_3130 [[Leptolyngbya] sp. PCC 7376]
MINAGFLALFGGNSGVEVSVILVVVGIFLPLALKASKDMQSAARHMGRLDAEVAGNKEELKELKESHKSIFQFLLNNSQSFRDSR